MTAFAGAAKKLDDIDIPKIAARLGVGEDELHAVMDVEAAGSGFDSKGRPKMLFEPHIFYRELGAGEQREEAVRQGLARKQWRRDYPKDSYPVLEQARKINDRAALLSCSWGAGQIMGFNFSLAGYETIEEMLHDFMQDEEAHIDAVASFIIASQLDDELRRHDWKGFARGYNGAAYAANGYHTKLASRFAWWSKKQDTLWPEVTLTEPLPPSKIEDKYSRIKAIVEEE